MYYQRQTFGIGSGLTPVVKNILFANAIIFFIKILNVNLYEYLKINFALNAYAVLYGFKIWQLVTYMFLHADFWHIFFNMFAFWMFGVDLEREWGSKEFLKYYFICGIGAGIVNMLFSPNALTIGASGAVYGVAVAFAIYFPERVILINFIIPVKAKYIVIIFLVMSFLSQSQGIAHAAHLGGIAVGYIYLKFGRFRYHLKKFFKSSAQKTKLTYKQGKDDAKLEYYRLKINELLDKINKVGYLNLTKEEKELLEEGSKYLREHDPKDYH